MMGGVPQPLRALGAATAIISGGMLALSLASSLTMRTLRAAADAKRRKGYYICKLCKGNSTIEWSPLYDPVVINPCVCPTCDGNRLELHLL
ncbi:hypothetical protein CK203_072074 [Vitis vinifera]|uniref:Uncharacterized protein n=1 Tax=Vitis vinifera TaxID=29760 RepID=A0A438EX92_VITVI|nr:hypothetical protein CK203_072074 [Vitis vinifera]